MTQCLQITKKSHFRELRFVQCKRMYLNFSTKFQISIRNKRNQYFGVKIRIRQFWLISKHYGQGCGLNYASKSKQQPKLANQISLDFNGWVLFYLIIKVGNCFFHFNSVHSLLMLLLSSVITHCSSSLCLCRLISSSPFFPFAHLAQRRRGSLGMKSDFIYGVK